MFQVEIGGDGQSTDGTEPSHMHERDDLSCNRGYEFWLLEEARKRNPAIKTFALSWASPAWVGNQTGYFSQDEIDYHVKWLQCTKQYEIGNIDYIGASVARKRGVICLQGRESESESGERKGGTRARARERERAIA